MNVVQKKNLQNEVYNFQPLQQQCLDLLNQLITDYLQKESIQLLLQKDKIIFGDDKLDITKEILKIFNEKHSKISFE